MTALAKNQKKPARVPRTIARAESKPRSTTKHGYAARKGMDDTDHDRVIWKGAISFGLVQIPVGIVSAEKTNDLSFHQLDGRDLSPIGYQRINKRTGKKVEWDDIVKGYEVSKGQFVVVTEADFGKANVKATQTIDIQQFVKRSDIAIPYFERPYYLIPEGKISKAYAVLRDAMEKKDLVAIALVVIRTRQHLCAVIAQGPYLYLELLRFAHELREAPIHEGAGPSHAGAKEVQLAEKLIGSMVGKWNPARYLDTYRDDLLAAIDEKAKTGRLVSRNKPAKASSAPTNLLAMLQASIHATKKGASTGSTKRLVQRPKAS